MAEKQVKMDAKQLKNDLKSGNIGTLYIMYGQEDYLREYYLQQLQKQVVDDTFREFNLQILEGKSLTLQQLDDAIESYPAMAERKMVVIRDFDLNKISSDFSEYLQKTIPNLPDYICLIFYFDVIPFKLDKRMKLHALFQKYACISEFSPLSERELVDWIRRHCKALGKGIDDETCAYMIFLCGTSMTNLLTEIQKVVSFSTLDTITRYHVDSVCSRIMDAVIFDLTDALAKKDYNQSIQLVTELIAQKNDEIQIFSAIIRMFQRIYAAKLAEQNRMPEKHFFEIIHSHSPYYARKLKDMARKFDTTFLRKTILLFSDTDVQLKQSVGDKKKLIEFTLLSMASNFGEIK